MSKALDKSKKIIISLCLMCVVFYCFKFCFVISFFFLVILSR